MSSDASVPEETEAVPSYRHIFRFYLPLALSWLLMAAELPITAAVVSRSIGAEVQTAALQLMTGLAIWIESPVIDLLATSTTLSKNRRDFATISRFVWWLLGITAVVHALVALTPLYDLVTHTILGIPESVAEAARLPMAILIPWSPFIGWRRYLQGVLIRYGRTRSVGWGTGVRVLTMGGVSLSLFHMSGLSGIMIAAIALVSSVAAEALFIHVASREVVRVQLREDDTSEPLSPKRLVKFHLPLTATTMTFMVSLPLTSAAIAHSPDGVAAMAAWQVATSLAFMHRCVVFALPEPVIALSGGPQTARKLARFCLAVGLAASVLIPLFVFLGVDRFLFETTMGASKEVSSRASLAYLATAGIPLLVAGQSYLRGMLTAHHYTSARLGAVLASTGVLLLLLKVGVEARWPGVYVAALGLSGAAAAELLALVFGWRSARRKLSLSAS